MMANSPMVTHTAVGTSVTESSHPHPHPQLQSQLHLGVSLSSAARPAALASTDTKGPDEAEIPSALTRSVAIAVSLPTEPKRVTCIVYTLVALLQVMKLQSESLKVMVYENTNLISTSQ